MDWTDGANGGSFRAVAVALVALAVGWVINFI